MFNGKDHHYSDRRKLVRKQPLIYYHHQYHCTTSKSAGLMEYSRRVPNRMEVPQESILQHLVRQCHNKENMVLNKVGQTAANFKVHCGDVEVTYTNEV